MLPECVTFTREAAALWTESGSSRCQSVSVCSAAWQIVQFSVCGLLIICVWVLMSVMSFDCTSMHKHITASARSQHRDLHVHLWPLSDLWLGLMNSSTPCTVSSWTQPNSCSHDNKTVKIKMYSSYFYVFSSGCYKWCVCGFQCFVIFFFCCCFFALKRTELWLCPLGNGYSKRLRIVRWMFLN